MENPQEQNLQGQLFSNEPEIKYGQIISISHFQDDQAFLHSDGHVKKNLMVRNFPSFHCKKNSEFGFQLFESPHNLNKDQQQKHQFTSCLFQIYPRMTNLVKQEIVQDQLDIDEDTIEDDQIWEDIFKQKNMKEKLDKQKIHEDQTKIKTEFKYNYEQFQKLINTKVYYYQPIQLMHIDSSKFLSCHPQRMAKIQNQNYALGLQDYTSEATMFKIIPAFKYQKDGDQVVFSKEIIQIVRYIPFHNKTTYIHSSDKDIVKNKPVQKKESDDILAKLHMQNNLIQFEDENMGLSYYERPRKQIDFKQQYPPKKGIQDEEGNQIDNDNIVIKREANCSLEETFKWKINLFQDFIPDNDTNLCCYNVIWLHHSETSATITAARKKSEQLDLKDLQNKDKLEIKMGLHTSSDSFKDYSGDTFGMWVIENKEFTKGGYVKKGNDYRLKHLPSGLFLTVQQKIITKSAKITKQSQKNSIANSSLKQSLRKPSNQENQSKLSKKSENINTNEEIKYELALSAIPDQYTLFNFETLSQQDESSHEEDKYIQANSFIFLKNTETNMYIHVINPYSSSVGNSQFKKQQFYLEPSLSVEKSEDQLFNMYQASESEVWEIKYVMQCFSRFTKLIKQLQQLERTEQMMPDQMKLIQKRVNQCQNLLKDIDLFLNNMHNNSSPDNKYGVINEFRQKLLREQYYIDILFKILEMALTDVELAKWTRYEPLKQQKLLEQQEKSFMQSETMRDNKTSQKGSRRDLVNQSQDKSYDKSMFMPTSPRGGPRKRNQFVSEFEYLTFLNDKALLCYNCYYTLESICKNNKDNQQYLYQQIPKIYLHLKYFEPAVKMLINIFPNNEQILQKLGANFDLNQIEKWDSIIKMHQYFDTPEEIIDQNNQIKEEPDFDQGKQVSKFAVESNRNTGYLEPTTPQYQENFSGEKGYKGFVSRNQSRQLSRNISKQIEMSNNNTLGYKYDSENNINLIYFFFKMMIENTNNQTIQINCYKFLSSICVFQGDGVTQNQEIIYNLFQKFKKNDNTALSVQIPNFFPNDKFTINKANQNLVCEQLSFYSDLSLARNYLWKKELLSNFKMNSLLENIWEKQDNIQKEDEKTLKSQLAKLTMSLYIDHDPLHKKTKPVLCRIFKQSSKMLKQQNEIFEKDSPAFQSYMLMIDDLKLYFDQVSKNLEQIFQTQTQEELELMNKKKVNDKDKNKIKKQQSMLLLQKDALKDKLLQITTFLLNLTISLNLYGILGKNEDYKELVKNLLTIISYDKSNLRLMAASYTTYQEQNKKRKELKEKETNAIAGMGGLVSGFAKGMIGGMKGLAKQIGGDQKENNDDDDDEEFNLGGTDDNTFFANPLRRGLMKLQNVLQSIHYEDYSVEKTQIQIKIQICDTINQILDLRQDFLISNIIYWFTETIAFSQEQDEEGNIMDIDFEKILKFDIKSILPNIAKTGIIDVDDVYKPQEEKDKGGVFSQLSSLQNMFDKKKSIRFNNYFKSHKDKKKQNTDDLNSSKAKNLKKKESENSLNNPSSQTQEQFLQADVEEFYDIDTLLSMGIEKSNDDKILIGAALPSLITTYVVVHDQNLEKKLLKTIMRIFNQRQELVDNLQDLQVIFEPEKRKFFLYIQMVSNELKKYIELSEIWLSDYIKSDGTNRRSIKDIDTFNQQDKQNNSNIDDIEYVQLLLKNLEKGLLDNLVFRQIIDKENSQEIQSDNIEDYTLKEILITEYPGSDQTIDADKQKIYNYLSIYESIIDFLKDGMHHFQSSQSDKNLSLKKKKTIQEIFCITFRLLKNFCTGNQQNQKIMYQYLSIFMSYLQFDLGQIDLICEIFKDNIELIRQVDNNLIQQFASSIRSEGRQRKFLNFFLSILKCDSKYVFDNQLMVLNTFLPIDITIKEKKLLYAVYNEQEQKQLNVNDRQHIHGTVSPQNSRLTPNASFIGSHSKQNHQDPIINQDKEDSKNNNNDIIFNFEDVSKNKNMESLKTDTKSNEVIDEPFTYHAKLLELLLETTYINEKEEGIEPYENKSQNQFNICIAKLKKTFKTSYLVKVLQEKDDFIKTEQFLDPLNSRRDSKNINQESIMDEIIKKKAIESGMTKVKPTILQFLMVLHVQSEKNVNMDKNENIVEFRREIGLFIDQEGQRIVNLEKEQINNGYVSYLFDNLLTFILCYIDKYLKNTIGSNEDDNRRDEKALQQFQKILKDKIMVFENLLTQRQISRAQKLINEPFFLENKEDMEDNIKHFIIPFQGVSKIQFNFKSKLAGLSSPKKSNLGKGIIQAGIFKSKKTDFKKSVTINKDEENVIQNKEINIEMQEQPNNQKQKSQTEKLKDEEDTDAIKKTQSKSGLNLMKSVTKFMGVKKQTKVSRDNFDIEIVQDRWQEFISYFTSNDNNQVTDEIDLEKQAIADAILQCQQYMDSGKFPKVHPQIDLKLIMKKFIVFLSFAVNDNDYVETVINLLQVIKQMIIKAEEDGKEAVQNQFNEYGCTNMILNVICDTKDLNTHIFHELILTINTLLDGGNNQVQSTIYEYFSTHAKTEKIFQKLHDCIQNQISQIEQKSKNKQQSQTMSLTTTSTIDTLTGETGGSTINDQQDSHSLELLQSILSFLQQSVEGHYLNLQNYFKHQTNTRNNYDLIITIVDLLKAFYFDARQQKYYLNMIQCLDTLTELVQGPCEENQLAVSESKFLDIANDLFTYKPEKKDTDDQSSGMSLSKSSKMKNSIKSLARSTSSRRKKNQDLEGWMIARLQNKCLVLILSLIENRDIFDKNSIVKTIQRDITVDIIEKHLRKSFRKYQHIYGTEYRMNVFQHISNIEDPVKTPKLYEESIQKKSSNYKYITQDQYLECIIENGFYFYFLLRYYIEVSPEQIEQSTLDLHNKFQKAFIDRQQDGLQKVFGDNIFGQLASFVHQIFFTFYDQAKRMQKFAAQQVKSISKEEQAKQKEQKKQEKQKLFKEAFQFFSRNTGQIDVCRQNFLEIIFFMKLPFCHSLEKEIKQKFQQDVDRTTNKTKVQELVLACDEFIKIMKHEEQLNYFFSHNPLLALIANYVKLWKDLAFIFTIILNIFIIGSFSSKYGDRINDYHLFQMESYDQQRTDKYFSSFGYAMAICSCFVVSFFLFKTLPLIIQKVWVKGEGGIIRHFINWILNLLRIVFQLLQEMEVLYYIAYGVFAVMGVSIHPFFFSFHLTEILIRYPTLKNVINSVWYPREAIGLSFLLFIILVYVFSIIGFVFFRNDFQNSCDEMWICFLFYFDWTFKANGGASGWITDNSEEAERAIYSPGRLIWDTFSNLILVVIMVNIVAGIIIDTFGDLRDKEVEKQQDIKEKCFICGNDKSDFDKQQQSGGFDKHIRIDHYMWNYVFYIAYLKWKDPNDYMGVESYVNTKLEKDDTSWFPFNKSRYLKNVDEADEIIQNELEVFKDLKRSIDINKNELSVNKKKIDIQFNKQKNQTNFQQSGAYYKN